jgi:hypothetical protein
MANLHHMGTFLYPAFEVLKENVVQIQWLSNQRALHHLAEMGFEKDSIQITT